MTLGGAGDYNPYDPNEPAGGPLDVLLALLTVALIFGFIFLLSRG